MNDFPVLAIDGLTVRRDERRSISEVSMTVARASVHLLIGPNGAGKSTLFAAILGLLEFTGSIRSQPTISAGGVVGADYPGVAGCELAVPPGV